MFKLISHNSSHITMKVDILGVNVDKVNMTQSVEQVLEWVKKGGKHYIVTPNVEIIMAAQEDKEFREILNKADLAIPDSARIGWANEVLNEKNPFAKLLKWMLFLFPTLGGKSVSSFPNLFQVDIVTGTDLMEELIQVANEKGFTVGFLGGHRNVADKLVKVLKGKYPELKVVFAESGGEVDMDGNMTAVRDSRPKSVDILFVAFGHVKQEKWIAKNLEKYPVKVMMGVGGAFDYLSGSIPRAPLWVRNLGLEWLFRLGVQPWRIRRFGNLIRFLFKVLFTGS